MGLIGTLSAVACGSTTTQGGDAGGESRDAAGGAEAGAADGGNDAQGRGCAIVGADVCPPGQNCCSGVPYPEDGVCAPTCDMKSDRDTKESLVSVDGDAVLDKVSRLRVTRWNYRDQPNVQHIGPMAQDFHAAFGVGHDERVITAVDANGVALAAIQALHRRVERLETETAQLRDENARLRRESARKERPLSR